MFELFNENFKNSKKAIIIGNGPSINDYDWDYLKKINEETGNKTIFLSCNRISNFYNTNSLIWRPDIFSCFTSLSLCDKGWIKSIDRCLKNKNIYSFVFDNYQNVSKIKDHHSNVYFCNQVVEHNRHQKIHQDFINVPINKHFIKSYSATVPLFQITNYLNIKEIAIIGQDGYTLPKGENHFNKSYGFEPKDFKRSNDRIINLHMEIKRYFKSKKCIIFNSSKQSILKKIYDFKDIKYFIKS